MRLVIVGAGIVGAACAYAAAGLGAQVTLVDAARPGQATAAGAGIICPWTSAVDDPVWYDFGCLAAREYPALIAGLADLGAGDVSYRRVGALLVGESGDQLEQARRRLVARQAGAPEMGEVALLDEGQARDLFPPLRPGAAALYLTGAARVDGRRLAAALVRAAGRRGAETKAGEAALSCRDGRVTGVTVAGEHLAADAVVVAAGAWTRDFLAPAGVTVRVAPQRGQIAHIKVAQAGTGGWPVVLPSATGHYLLAFDDSRVVAGATRETGAGFDARVTPGGLAEVLANALAVAPGLADGTLHETRVGLRPAGPDARPLLGPVRVTDGAPDGPVAADGPVRAADGPIAADGTLVVATGLGASGLTMGPLTGTIAARIALGLPPGVDLAPFDPLRS